MQPPTEALTLAVLLGTGVAIVVLLMASALLAAFGTATSTVSRSRLQSLAERGTTGAAQVLALVEDRERLVAAVLLGTTAANVLATALATGLCLRLLPHWGVAVAAIVMTLVITLLARQLPRAAVESNAEAAAIGLVRPIGPLVSVLAPVAGLFQGLAARLPVAARAEPEPDPRADLTERSPEAEERDAVLEALNLGERQVEEVMMHRRDIEMIDAEAPPDEILSQAIASPHTRLPIFRGEPENIVGVIHAKDLSRAVHAFVQDQRGAGALDGFDVMDVAMEPYFVPETTTLEEQLHEFLRRRAHFALVVDEYGALQGLVTLEDILEEIVGNITDEHDVETADGIERQPDGSVDVDGSVSIRELNRACDWNLPDEEANTIAGLVLHESQSIPNEGEVFSFHGFRFEVLGREHQRLTRLRVRRLT
ncbi:Mg2+/Co2+ transporter CorB [Amaricoccus macauensis]|uniref:Mg2+/Co2+ transporter CorB n=1 Tax=Amaricoccus macauensis TaxID=57001 RepID=A0A840SN81_9RHOB|nr:CNNM domain-containing protein [Amaricoccus macauensis]MBB5222464.1 Mg2+/Co2+ transporter CorB [Amaricoccus macauensis]